MSEQHEDFERRLNSEIDPVAFGQLVATVGILAIEVTALRMHVETLTGQITSGKGILAGLALAAGGVGAGASHLLDKFLR
jgi:hypothetical protein